MPGRRQLLVLIETRRAFEIRLRPSPPQKRAGADRKIGQGVSAGVDNDRCREFEASSPFHLRLNAQPPPLALTPKLPRAITAYFAAAERVVS